MRKTAVPTGSSHPQKDGRARLPTVLQRILRTDALPGRPYLPHPGRTGLLDARALRSARDGWEHFSERAFAITEAGRPAVDFRNDILRAIGDLSQGIDNRLTEIVSAVDQRFNTTDEGFSTIDRHFHTIQQFFNTIDHGSNTIDSRFNTIDNSFQIVNRFNSVDNGFQVISGGFNGFDQTFMGAQSQRQWMEG